MISGESTNQESPFNSSNRVDRQRFSIEIGSNELSTQSIGFLVFSLDSLTASSQMIPCDDTWNHHRKDMWEVPRLLTSSISFGALLGLVHCEGLWCAPIQPRGRLYRQNEDGVKERRRDTPAKRMREYQTYAKGKAEGWYKSRVVLAIPLHMISYFSWDFDITSDVMLPRMPYLVRNSSSLFSAAFM